MRSFLFLHFVFVGTAEFTETEATAFCCLVSVLNVLHENLGIICECSSAVILVGVCTYNIQLLMWQFYCIHVEGKHF